MVVLGIVHLIVVFERSRSHPNFLHLDDLQTKQGIISHWCRCQKTRICVQARCDRTPQHMKQLNYSLCLASTLSFLCLTTNHPTIAQIVPDATLPSNSVAIPNGNSISIEGGTNNGSNLFHSFQEFSVPTGTEAFFNNGLDIQNIFSRVTGKNISNIDGLIRANGTANLFLINPNGIIFGQNAQLNIGGSFIGSTANSIRFIDGSEFSTTNPTAPSLLTINVPIGLQFGANPGSIINRSIATFPANIPTIPLPIPNANNVGLAVQPGQTLALVGGDIQLDAGNLTASTGQILLGSVASPGLVSFVPTPLGLNLNYGNIQNFGNIEINSSLINTSGLGGGKIDVRGGNVILSSSGILGLTLGNIDGRGIDINAQNLRVDKGSQISTPTLGDGNGSDINIRGTDSVEISGIGFDSYQKLLVNFRRSGTIDPFDPQLVLLTGTVGTGTAGDIAIDTGRLLMRDGVVGGTPTSGAGNGGNINIRANVFDQAGSTLSSGSLLGSSGTAGNITVAVQKLTMRDGGLLTSITSGEGAAGNIDITAAESVEVLRTLPGSSIQTLISAISIDPNGKGRAGDITLDTKQLIVAQGAGIAVSSGGTLGNSSFSNGGPGGNLTIRASESVELAGISGLLANGGYSFSFLASETSSSNGGGNIYIATPVLRVRDGGIIFMSAFGTGNAGNLTIDASSVEVSGTALDGQLISQIDVSAGNFLGTPIPNATGNAGSINLNVGRLIVRDGAAINVRAQGTPNAGTLTVVADSIALDNKGSINGTTDIGGGGNINLQAQNIQLRGNSRISTNAGNATSGNIDINTNTLVALENSDITANAIQGSGGRVSITAQGIFGTQFRESLTPQSDITATSDLGPQFSGTVQINTPNVDPASGLVELSVNFTDFSNLVARSCAAAKGNSLRVTGRGGLPTPPSQPLTGSAVWVDLRSVGQQRDSGLQGIQAENFPFPNQRSPTIEATGWKINQNGQVELVANEKGADGSPWYINPSCGV
ncbi:filamentous hemagglutinin N-terminal domain-containing protein [Argonema antarcticum]|uniref:two-partner secretion domain-containing protein n=1 Tax=Argonema antarcticum TaxID=2942763 RepID=UPI0020126137|nr:S-layer family protein [Argonema antarcticum]MCL1470315.1 S-layer family protein [Argonema antarcticum A004/B2]